MRGMCAATGQPLDGVAHLKQSIRDILTTPVGSRVMRRDYGSRLFALLDAPMTPAVRLDLFAATAEALARWEPRLALAQVTLDPSAPAGQVILALTGHYRPTGQVVTLEGITLP